MVEGLDRLERKLKRTIPAKAIALTRKAMEQSAEEIVQMMKRLVPVDEGALRDSIGWTWGEPPKGAMVIAKGAPIGDGLRITIFAGTRDKKLGDLDAFHARFVEFGTQNMAAQPYFFVSFRALRRRAANRMKRQMRKGIAEGSK